MANLKLINIFFLLAILILLIFIFQKCDIYNDKIIISLLKQIKNNHNKKIISEISNNKQENFSDFIFFEFKGIEEGCIKKFEIKKGKCNFFEKLFYNTKKIKEIDSSDFKVLYKKNLYVKYHDLNYYDIIKNDYISNNKQDCLNKNFNSCGKIDSLDNFLCVPKEIECPKATIKNFIEEFNNNNKLISDKNNEDYSNYLFIDDYKISEDTPCINLDEENIYHLPYKLEKNYNKKYQCNTILFDKINKDERYKQILTINSKKDFYLENSKNLSDLYNYNFDNIQLFFYNKNYISYYNNGNNNYNLLYNNDSPINNTGKLDLLYKINFYNKYLIRINLTFFLISFFIKFLKHFIMDKVCIIYDIITFSLIFLIFCFIIVQFCIINSLNKFKINDSINIYWDEIFNNELKYINNIIKNNKNNIKICLILITIVILLFCAFFIINVIRSSRKCLNIKNKIKLIEMNQEIREINYNNIQNNIINYKEDNNNSFDNIILTNEKNKNNIIKTNSDYIETTI